MLPHMKCPVRRLNGHARERNDQLDILQVIDNVQIFLAFLIRVFANTRTG